MAKKRQPEWQLVPSLRIGGYEVWALKTAEGHWWAEVRISGCVKLTTRHSFGSQAEAIRNLCSDGNSFISGARES